METHENLRITDPAELIDQLKQNPNVLGILRYGSSMWPDGADTDICIVVSQRPAGLESIHFWLGGGPVDLNIRTLEELKQCSVEGGFDEGLREGEVLYERQPGMLVGLSAKCSSKPSPPSRAEAPRMRHGHAHSLNKLDHHKDRDPLLCKVLLCGAVHWLLHAYASARSLPYRGEKATLKAIAAGDPALSADMETAAGSGSLTERIEALRRATEKVLKPVGGAWRRGEVIFFPERGKETQPMDEWQRFFDSLMQAGEST